MYKSLVIAMFIDSKAYDYLLAPLTYPSQSTSTNQLKLNSVIDAERKKESLKDEEVFKSLIHDELVNSILIAEDKM